ncbi:MAG: ECF transporter S component, partial [Erysipelotrichaceae bacterium]|nr:ECF transporter S component [Erysipelotrichaceae bacterium]
AIIYHKNKSQKSAIKGLIAGVVSLIIAGDLINYFVLIPAYVSMFHMPLEKIVAMGNAIFPFVTSKASFVLVCVSLFNLFKGILSSVVTLLVYKKVSPILHA